MPRRRRGGAIEPLRALATLAPRRQSSPTALWLVDALAGAKRPGVDVRGTACRRFGATVDVARASKLSPDGVAAPAVDRFEDPLALPIEVCIDERHVRRIRCETGHGVQTLELWGFGVDVDRLDWTGLPTFRSVGD
jgi:hypothetical protein